MQRREGRVGEWERKRENVKEAVCVWEGSGRGTKERELVDERERVLQEIEAAGGVTADTPEQQQVFYALPDGLRSALASGSLANVRLALALMSVDDVKSSRQRCVDVGMWAEGR